MSVIFISHKDGPLEGKRFPVYGHLVEGRLFTAAYRIGTYADPLFIQVLTYRLQKNNAGEWELAYVEIENV
jgi:hypothetical protein